MSYDRERQDKVILRKGRSDGEEIIAVCPPPSLMKTQCVPLSTCHARAKHCFTLIILAANIN